MNINVFYGETKLNIHTESGAVLSDVLRENGIFVNYPCAGKGRCGNCAVEINGKKELCCRYVVSSDADVVIPERVQKKPNVFLPVRKEDKTFIALDIGTTTLELALCFEKNGAVAGSITAENPQRQFGPDVISRISYCMDNGPSELNRVLISCINALISSLLSACGVPETGKLIVAGNTTMLHLFMNEDCSSLGTAPYKPVFLGPLEVSAEKCGIEKAGKVCLLPCFNAFTGADVISGLAYAGIPSENKYSILADLGTNAETVLFSRDRILFTSAAAGPCFEGANISDGMSSVPGAVYSYSDNGEYSVIDGINPAGICATGLIDIIAALLRKGVIDENGYMEEEQYPIAPQVSITRNDIRQFQLAKSAVFSAISVLIEKAGISFGDIETFYVSGGFSEKLNIGNAVEAGLFPRELKDRFKPVNNSCIKGIIKSEYEHTDLGSLIEKAEYIDLAADESFSEKFIKNMYFK